MPVITVRRFDYDTLKNKLTADDKIVVLSCDSCARLSDGLGGKKALANLVDKLEADGFQVVYQKLLPAACSHDHLKGCLNDAEARAALEEANVVISLSCERGVQEADVVLPDLRAIRVTQTLGHGIFSPEHGAILTQPIEGLGLQTDDAEGMSIINAASLLGLHPGSF